jgi:SAM-dependent methyltransferase
MASFDRHRELLSVPAGAPEPGSTPDRCLVCGVPRPRALFERSGKRFWACRGCELVFVHDIYPEFTQDVAHLPETYEFGRPRAAKPRELREYARILARFERVRRLGSLLEVGCGQGVFLEAASRAGWRALGVEMLPELARVAREERGLDVRTGELCDARLPDASVDAAYMNEVIEHVVDPVALLGELRRVLRPGGIALLRTGNARSWSARVRGGGWSYYRFGGHLHIRFYSPRAAEALARAAGFDAVRCETRGFALREAGELRGRWYKPAVQIAQALVSPAAGPLGAGHRLSMWFERAEQPPTRGGASAASGASAGAGAHT